MLPSLRRLAKDCTRQRKKVETLLYMHKENGRTPWFSMLLRWYRTLEKIRLRLSRLRVHYDERLHMRLYKKLTDLSVDVFSFQYFY